MTTATLERVRELAPRLSKRSEEFEQCRRLPLDIVSELAAAGCWRMLVPREFGGDQMTLRQALEVVEELSRADGATGWTVMIGASSPTVFGLLPRQTFEEIYADGPDVIGAGTLAPKGTAVVVDGGYRVSGQWPFASGCQHATWVLTQSVVLVDGAPKLMPNGMPTMRMTAFRPEEVEVVDTWHVSGLLGTGSHDIRLQDVFCPEERSTTFFGGSPTVEGTVYRISILSQLGLFIASVALGIAAAALDDVTSLARSGKRPAFTPRRVAESPLFQDRVGQADSLLRAARSLVHAEADTAWARAEANEPFSLLDRARLRTTGPQATELCVNVVDMAYGAAGGSAVYDSSPLQRHLRDIHTLTQHYGVGRDFYPIVGALLAGEEVDAMRI